MRVGTAGVPLLAALLAARAPACEALRPLRRAAAQQIPFAGIGKNTWSATDAQSCLAWFMRYLPGVERAVGECDGDVCPCAQEGRGQLSDSGFGIHTVNCTFHPHGACRPADVEAGFRRAYGGLREYTPLMDHNLGLWAASLAPALDAFDAGGVGYLPLRWQEAGAEYYSVIANPCGYVLIELMSDTLGPGRARAEFRDFPMSRMSFAEWNVPPAPAAGQCYLKYDASGEVAKAGVTACVPGNGSAAAGYGACTYKENTDVQNSGSGSSSSALGRAGCCAACAADPKCKASVYADATGNPYGLAPVKVSRATTRADAVAAFYQAVFGATVARNVTGADGTRAVTLKLPDTTGGKTLVHIQLWQRPAGVAAPRAGCDEWDVAKWEAYLLATHEAVMHSPTCGMDRWLDNHFSYDCQDAHCDAGVFGKAMEAAGVRYRLDPFMGDKWFVYSYDPSGMGVELHFSNYAGAPPDVSVPPSCIHGSFDNGTCAGQEPGQCT